MSVFNIYLFFLIVVYRLSHWHASFHTHFGFTWFIVLAMQKRTVTALFCCMLQLYIVHCLIKARKTKHTGTLNMLYFFGVHFLANLLQPYKQNVLAQPCFLHASALYHALPHQSYKSKMHRHKNKSLQCFV